MEKLLTEIKRLVHEYEERQREKTMVLTGTVKGDSIFNSLQHSLQDVNAAGQLHDSSGVEIINSLYKAVHAYIESEDKLKAELAEKSDVIRKLKEENEELSRLAKHLSDAVRKGDDQKVKEKPDSSGVEELSPYIEQILQANEELKILLAEKNRELDEKKKAESDGLYSHYIRCSNEYLTASVAEEVKKRVSAEEALKEKEEVIANMTNEIKMKDEKIKELARDYNRMMEERDSWKTMVISKPHPDEQLRRHIAVYEDLIVDKNRKINELESHIEILKMFTTGRIDFEKELENKKKEITFLQEKLESKNKRIKELEDGDKGEGKVDRFEAGIEKLNEIVEVLNKWAYMQKGVISVFPKDRTDGGPECHFNHR